MQPKYITPVTAIIAGVCVLIFPALLNYVIGIYLIVTGILGLSDRR